LQQQNITKKIKKNPNSILTENNSIQKEAEIEKQETDIVQTEEPNKTEMEEVEEPKKASVDISLNTVIMKDPLEKKEEENISYSISNI
jgi:hypothetical protein